MAANNHTMPSLPQDIIINILKRLPVIDLLRFRCVCKDWRHLFKTQSFIQEHLHHSTHHKSSLLMAPMLRDDGFYYSLDDELPNFLVSLNQELQFREVDVAHLARILEINHFFLRHQFVGSSNGLLCFQDRAYPHQAKYIAVLWNPATREVRRVPVIPHDLSHPFPPKHWVFGFGYSPIIEDYKIVRISVSPMVSMVEVYSLRTGCWRNIGFDKIKDVSVKDKAAVTANGVMFWHGTRIMDREYIDVVVSFDLANEVFTVISWPPSVERFFKLAVYDDKLAIVSHPKIELDEDNFICGHNFFLEHDYFSLYFEVMEEGYIDIGSSKERWSSSERYNSDSRLSLAHVTIWRNQIVAIYHEVLNVVFPRVEIMNYLYLVDVNVDDCKRLDIPIPKTGTRVHVFNYVESLVPINGNIQIEDL